MFNQLDCDGFERCENLSLAKATNTVFLRNITTKRQDTEKPL